MTDLIYGICVILLALAIVALAVREFAFSPAARAKRHARKRRGFVR
jgi:hypothetical protein